MSIVIFQHAARSIMGSCNTTWRAVAGLVRTCRWFEFEKSQNSSIVSSALNWGPQSSNSQAARTFASFSEVETAGRVCAPQPALDALNALISLKNTSGLTVESKALAFCALYQRLTRENRSQVLTHIVHLWVAQYGNATKAAQSFLDAKDKSEAAMVKAEEKLRDSLGGDLLWVLHSIVRVEGGIKFLIDLRADVLQLLNEDPASVTSSGLKALSNAVKDLLAPCFASDVLQLDRVTWSSPGDLLQKVSEGEAVHAIRSWADLKRRLGAYRRCYVLNHPALPMQPVAILHVALTDKIPKTIHHFVPRSSSSSTESNHSSDAMVGINEDISKVDTAIFYSISSTQKGLSGIDLGQCLIKRAVRRLQAELPSIHHFSTLSPIPGFRGWLLHQIREAERGQKEVLTRSEIEQLGSAFVVDDQQVIGQLKEVVGSNSWVKDPTLSSAVEPVLMRLCAWYLLLEKRRNYALDSVANFHLRNGAVMWRLNWMADLSPRGLSNSCGMMVNYRYYLEMCEENSRSYVENHRVEVSDQIWDLAHSVTGRPSRL